MLLVDKGLEIDEDIDVFLALTLLAAPSERVALDERDDALICSRVLLPELWDLSCVPGAVAVGNCKVLLEKNWLLSGIIAPVEN